MQNQSTYSAASANREFLSFSLGREEYAMNILQVQEIRSYETPTHIATAPEYVKGVINLRGAIVPVHDLRLKLGSGEAVYDQTTAVIVTNVGQNTIGFVVDRVSDVLALTEGQMHPLPDMGTSGIEYITGLGVIDERTLTLVDAAKLCA